MDTISRLWCWFKNLGNKETSGNGAVLELSEPCEEVFEKGDGSELDSAIIEVSRVYKKLREESEDYAQTAELASDETAKFKTITAHMLEELVTEDEKNPDQDE